ncbi:restriction endonuclease PLD domain-containing protein [Candidatus Latescibacterota bacterium]
MFSKELFEKVLVEPVKKGCNKLYIVSGYATAAMAFHHLDFIKKIRTDVNIELLVGMCPTDGISLSNHNGFQHLMGSDSPDNFKCSYIMTPPSVHSKVYSWFSNDDPCCGFIGSTNYTQMAFGSKQREVIDECDPNQALDYYKSLNYDTIFCTHPEAENYIHIYKDKYFMHRKISGRKTLELDGTEIADDITGLPNITISFLDRYGNLPQRSGLNWGQRPEAGREPNQAYIRLTSEIYRTDFFPPKTAHFTVSTDDSKVLICSRAQEKVGKAIHTPHNNSLIGEYFRHRLGIPNGHPVTTDDLLKYGRTDVTFFKIDNETYFMDFSV